MIQAAKRGRVQREKVAWVACQCIHANQHREGVNLIKGSKVQGIQCNEQKATICKSKWSSEALSIVPI